MSASETGCCPRFDPARWDQQVMSWHERPFVKDRVRSLLHIPLNFGGVMKRVAARIEAADAMPDDPIVLADENSLWGADVYVHVSKNVPEARMATLSGTFVCKVFEGPYKNVRTWVNEMDQYVRAQGKETKKLYFYYTTCPRCAKVYGKNYVVLMAQV
jgi:hypothetical protein